MAEWGGTDVTRKAQIERDRDFALILDKQCANCPHRIGDHAAFANAACHWVCMIEGCVCDGTD